MAVFLLKRSCSDAGSFSDFSFISRALLYKFDNLLSDVKLADDQASEQWYKYCF